MKQINQITIVTIAVISLAACKKEKEEFILTTNLTVVNAAVDMSAIKANVRGTTAYNTTATLNYGAKLVYALNRTSVPVTVVNAADTTAKLFSGNIDFRSGIYTMYLVGQAPTTETIIEEETNFPFIRTDQVLTATDSVVNVRFINLSPNSVPVKIKISSSATNEVDNLPYKTISDWKAFKAGPAATTTYSFQVRNAATDALLTTFNFAANNAKRFKNVSIIIKGLQGTTTGTNAFGVFEVNYF